MRKPKHHQPKIGKWLLSLLTHYEDEFSGSGDFGEEFEERVSEKGKSRALLWYWMQVAHAVWSDFKLSILFGGIMIKNILKITLRNIKRQKLYAFINIAGLAVGLIVCILMVLYIRFELTFDGFHTNADRIYRVNAHDLGRDLKFAGTQALLAETLKKDFPEVRYAARLKGWNGYFKCEDTMFGERRFLCADPDFKDIFTYPLVTGDIEAMKEPFSLFISQKLADKYFRDENPIGKTLSYNNRHEFIIRGVLKDVPDNSYLQFDLLVSMATLDTLWGEKWMNRWISHDFNTFIMLEKNADPAMFEEKLQKFIRPPDVGHEEVRDVYFSQSLRKIHFGAGLRSEIGGTNDIRYIFILSATVLMIVLIACFNYMTLATARASKRMREIGLRKVVGAGRLSLIRQFLGESILFSLLAFAIAVTAVKLLLPWFNQLMNRNLEFSFLNDLSVFSAISLLIGIAAGLYPAFYLSSFQPTKLFRANVPKDSGSSSLLRKSLVVTQFVITIALITCLLIVRNQIDYLTKNSMGGFDSIVVTVRLNDGKLQGSHEALLQAFEQSPQVLDSTVSYSHPLNISWGMGMGWIGEENEQFVRLGPVDFNYIDFYGLKIIRGRKMMEEMGTDRAEAVILNETAARAAPWEDPIGKRCRVDEHEGVVIGIVEDFHFKSLYNQVEPLALRHLYKEGGVASGAGFISLKISSYDIPGTLKYLEDTWEKFSAYFPFEYAFLDETVDSVYRSEIRLSRSLTSFTAIAIFLACLGLFGLTSFTAERRTKEIGIRRVLGASPKGIFLLLSRDVAKWVVLATAAAFPLAYYAMHEWLNRFAYRIDIGWGTYALATAFSLLIALLAMSYQSIRAATANPVDSLRYE
jgi:putative ABC transport system permease protein